jgi:hypothetical protein
MGGLTFYAPTRVVAERSFSRVPAPRRSQVIENNRVGAEWDVYVQETKLRRLDEAGQLDVQERLPTPDLRPVREYVQPDYTISNSRGGVAAYADAKSGIIPCDAQAQGLIRWSATTESRTLIYYVPREVQLPRALLDFARQNRVRVITVIIK